MDIYIYILNNIIFFMFANGYIFCRNINFFICLITDILMTILVHVG